MVKCWGAPVDFNLVGYFFFLGGGEVSLGNTYKLIRTTISSRNFKVLTIFHIFFSLLRKIDRKVLLTKTFFYNKLSPFYYFLKGQSTTIFDIQTFSSFKLAWATDQWIEIFSILVKISPSCSNFSESPWGMTY